MVFCIKPSSRRPLFRIKNVGESSNQRHSQANLVSAKISIVRGLNLYCRANNLFYELKRIRINYQLSIIQFIYESYQNLYL
jgi:hypothetical protein